MAECIFCDIISGKSPSYQVWQDENHLAFLSIFPNTTGTTVVIPKKHIESYAFNSPNDVLHELVDAAKKVAKLLDAAFEDVARTAMVLEGYGVNHLHAKLYPLHGTASQKEWKPISSTLSTFFKSYPGYISSHDSDRASDKCLQEVADKIVRTNSAF